MLRCASFGEPGAVSRDWRALDEPVRVPHSGNAGFAVAKDSREPVVIVEGLERYVTAEDGPGAAELLRPPDEDLFA